MVLMTDLWHHKVLPSVKHVVSFARREGQQVGFHEGILCTVVLTLSSILSSSVENNIN